MDELELSGRRHISTRRAGKEHGYHSDYIGQLIRGGKVAGQKVGRSWYVDEESLRVYLGKNPAPVTAHELPAAPLLESPAPEEEQVIEIRKEPQPKEEKEEKVEIKKIGGLTYIADDEPLLPPVRTRQQDEERVAPVVPIEESVNVVQPHTRNMPHMRGVAVAVLCALAVAGASAAVSTFVAATTVVAEGQTASGYYSWWQK